MFWAAVLCCGESLDKLYAVGVLLFCMDFYWRTAVAPVFKCWCFNLICHNDVKCCSFVFMYFFFKSIVYRKWLDVLTVSGVGYRSFGVL
jgi:hypothetical protein